MANRGGPAWKPWLVLVVVLLVGWMSWPRDAASPPSDARRESTPATLPPLEAPRPGPVATDVASAASLPSEAFDTIRLVQRGGPYPHRQDGGVFGNREGHLPRRSRGWYREYTVDTPGRSNRGARRIVTGGNPPSEWYYTDDHYDSFRRIDVDGMLP